MAEVSMIVPVYQVEKYIAQCIESVLNQTFQDFELILVDDGSKDQSGIICDSYAAKDDRIIVIHTENRGAAAARNIGLDHASGRYITFLDGDDWIEKDTCSLVRRVKDQSVQMLIFGAVREYENHTVPFTMSYEDGHIFKEKRM